MAYLPRCGDVSPDIRTVAAQVIYFLLVISFISGLRSELLDDSPALLCCD